MPIRITGMNSGLDTDAIIADLIKAKSEKLNTLKKSQTKLEWKQDVWKTTNSKIYSFYSKALSNMRYQSSFNKKSTTISNTNVASVVAGDSAVNGSQSLIVKQLAKSGYLTGGRLSEDKSIKGSSKLNDALGANLSGNGTIEVTVGSKKATVEVNGDTTVSEFVDKLKEAGVNASFDSTNQRIFVSVADSGAKNDFSLTASNSDGLKALSSLGLVTADDIASNKDYSMWKTYFADTDDAILANLEADGKLADYTSAKASKLQNGIETMQKTIEGYQDALVKNEKELEKLLAAKEYTEAEGADTAEKLEKAESVFNAAKDALTENTEKLEYLALISRDETSLNDEQKEKLEEYAKKYSLPLDEEALKEEQTKLKDDVAAAKKTFDAVNAVKAKEDEILKTKEEIYNTYKDINDNALALNEYYATLSGDDVTEAITAAIDKNNQYISDATAYAAEYENVKGVAAGTYTLAVDPSFNIIEDAKNEIVAMVKTANDAVNNAGTYASNSAVRIAGQDAVIELNGAEFVSSTNSFTVNDLTITAKQVSAITGYNTEYDELGNEIKVPMYEEASINTADDISGVYNMIRDFFKDYNELVKELDTLYNADSSKGYDPLTEEEKESMTEKEIEQWEDKIKKALLRNDSDLGSVISSMKMEMLSTIEIGGQKYTLSSFGIETLGYFSSEENERGCYHIDGDPDDATTSGNADKLKKMIASDPKTVAEFFTKLAEKMYDKLNAKMKTTQYSSIYTVYEDKKIKSEIKDYDGKIDEAQERLNAIEDKYYKQFSAMETALSKLNSQQSALSSMLGMGG